MRSKRAALRHFLLWAAVLLCATVLSATTKKPPLKPVNINTATSEELQQVPVSAHRPQRKFC